MGVANYLGSQEKEELGERWVLGSNTQAAVWTAASLGPVFSRRQEKGWACQQTQPRQTLKAAEGEWLSWQAFQVRDKGKQEFLAFWGIYNEWLSA